MFKIGDVVEITEESDATGMLDFKDGKGYKVINRHSHQEILLQDEGGHIDWYHGTHFKLKGDTIVEKKECLFKEGQVVWDVVYGKGKVVEIAEYSIYPVVVQFSDETMAYSEDGKTYETHGRTLFFSEPKIEAATEPLFEPTLKEGDKVVCIDKNIEFSSGPTAVLTVIEEDEKFVETSEYGLMGKHRWDFYRLGEKINFK